MSIPIIGRRDLRDENHFGIKYEVVVAEKQKMNVPGGKREKVIVFSRVPQSQLYEDTTGKTRSAAKRAVTLLRERLQKSGLPKERVDALMQSMYAVDQRGIKNHVMKTLDHTLDAKALDVLLEKKAMKSGKVRFSEQAKAVPAPPVLTRPASTPMAPSPLPAILDLPPLPESP